MHVLQVHSSTCRKPSLQVLQTPAPPVSCNVQIELTLNPVALGSYQLPLFLRVSQGKQLQLLLRGEAVPENAAIPLHVRGCAACGLVFAPAPIGELEPPLQSCVLRNCGPVPLPYRCAGALCSTTNCSHTCAFLPGGKQHCHVLYFTHRPPTWVIYGTAGLISHPYTHWHVKTLVQQSLLTRVAVHSRVCEGLSLALVAAH